MLQANITDINALHILYNKTYIKLRQADHTCYYQWYVTPRHAVKAYGRMEVQLHSFLFSVLNGKNGQLYTSAALRQRQGPTLPTERS